MESKSSVAILGPLGTYTHQAAYKIFGSDVIYKQQPAISDIFTALSKDIPLGVVPHENSIFGAVTETYDLLRNTSSFICGEVTLKIEHSLLVKRGVKICDIKRVFSHEQALGQCRSFILEHLPGASIVKTPSTAAAAELLLTEPPDCAAICSAVCTRLYEGLDVLVTSIQDVPLNSTTFYVLVFTKNWESVVPRHIHRKALIRLSAPASETGDLQERDIVKYLKVLDLSAANINYRPALGAIPFCRMYFVEAFDCSGLELPSWTTKVESAINQVKKAGADAHLLGVW